MALEDRIRLPTLNLIHRRPRLLNMLNGFIEKGHRFITIYAPGGYGKSILLADFTQTTDLPVCWCSLETVDRDPTAFLTLLAHSITDRFHEIEPEDLLKLVQRGDTQNSIRRITELLDDVGPHIIIIDDYHKAVSAGMTLALNQLLDQLPDEITIIVAARGDMGLETGQVIDLLLSDKATGLSEEELRFTPDELQLMMRKRFGRRIDMEQALDISKGTDGNIAQVLLAGHMMRAGRAVGDLQQRLGDDRAIIYSYLADDVYGKQSPELQRFLLHTAILPDLTAELCDALLETSDAQARIEELVRRDLFITQIGAGFKYHDLFAEFLRSKLAEDIVLQYKIAVKAAELLADRTRSEEAVNLYLSVQAWDRATALLEAKGKDFHNTGRALTLNSWFELIPDQELTEHPHLLLLHSRVLASDLGKHQQSLKLLSQAEQQFKERDNSTGLAETYIYRAAGLRMMGRPTEALAIAAKGLKLLTILNADIKLVAQATRSRGLAYLITGNTIQALADLRRALELFQQSGDIYITGISHHEVGICLERQGNISGAEYHYGQALQTWETLGNANELSNTLNSLGVCAYLRGNYGEALKQFNNSLDIALQIGSTRRAAFAHTGTGDVYLECRDFEKAIESYTLSTEFAQEASARSLEIYNLIKKGDCFFLQDKLSQALNIANQAGELAAETDLNFEKGLALNLQARIYVRQAEYEISFGLFAEAMALFSQNDVLERVKVRLWWGYSLLLSLRPTAALEQLHESIRLTLTIGELIKGLRTTVAETQQLLYHFLYHIDTPGETRHNIWALLTQGLDEVDTHESGLQIFTFGSPTIIVAGERKQFNQRGGIRKTPEFLAYLLIQGNGSGCRWDEVSAALWPELTPERASTSFHQTLRRLREVIFRSPDYITAQDDHYQVNHLTWCDAVAFEELFARISKEADPSEALALRLELINLYQGEFLAGLELGEWGTTFRASCEARFIQTVRLAGEQLLQQRRPHEALAIIQRGLDLNYFREDLHLTVFKAYAQINLYDELTDHYEKLFSTFEIELNAPPQRTTTQLYQQLLSTR